MSLFTNIFSSSKPPVQILDTMNRTIQESANEAIKNQTTTILQVQSVFQRANALRDDD